MTAATTATKNVTQAMQKIPLSINVAGILLLVAVTVWCGPGHLCSPVRQGPKKKGNRRGLEERERVELRRRDWHAP